MNIESYKKCSSAISLQGREKSVRKSSIRASLKRTERAKLIDNLGNLSKEMHKRTQNELKSYASDNPEVKSEKKQEQKQIMTHN